MDFNPKDADRLLEAAWYAVVDSMYSGVREAYELANSPGAPQAQGVLIEKLGAVIAEQCSRLLKLAPVLSAKEHKDPLDWAEEFALRGLEVVLNRWFAADQRDPGEEQVLVEKAFGFEAGTGKAVLQPTLRNVVLGFFARAIMDNATAANLQGEETPTSVASLPARRPRQHRRGKPKFSVEQQSAAQSTEAVPAPAGVANGTAMVGRVEQDTRPTEPPESVFTHSADYRGIHFNGRDHTLTQKQAEIIKILDIARLQGRNPWISKAELLRAVEAETSSMPNLFKRSELWGTLVISSKKTKGMYRINLPAPSR